MLKKILWFSLILLSASLNAMAQIGPPSGIIGWWAGDGDGRDLSGNNFHGTTFNATYGVCLVGQGFDFRVFGGDISRLQVPDNPALKPAQLTMEVWVKFTPTFDNYAVAIAKGSSVGFNNSYALGTAPFNANPQFFTLHNGVSHLLAAPTNLANPNSWNHLAASYDGATKRLYVNGLQVASVFVGQPIQYDPNPVPLTIGSDWESNNPAYRFNGLVDEATLYNRALSDAEIAAIYNAGVGGKIKSAPTNAGANSQTIVGDATITFQNVTVPGTTNDYTIDPATQPMLPANHTHTGLAYEISTTAVYQQGAADDVRVCFNLPALSSMNFGSYRIFHLEGGNWVNRTDTASVYPVLCTDNLTSLSPFAIAQAPPSAASVSVSGRVLAGKRGVSGAIVILTDAGGNTRFTMTNGFGYYRFAEIPAGETYVFAVRHKRYQFTSLALTVIEEISELNFTAEP